MDNLDELILDLRNAGPENKVNIEDGLYISNEFIEFSPVQVIEGKIELMLPNNFAIMAPEDADLKYPSVHRPQEIWTSPDTATNFCISYFPELELTPEYLKEDAAEIKNALKKTNPAIEFYKNEVEELADFDLAWFDYKSFGIDHDMFNIMFIASVEGKMLHGVFICLFSEYELWSEVAHQMMKSMKIVKSA